MPQPTLSGISMTAEIVEGVLSVDTISWRTSVLLKPPFLDTPKITLVRESGSAAKDPVIELVTADKFTVKISSSDQQGEWIWRARGPLLAATTGIDIQEGVLSVDTISWRTSVLLKPPFLDTPKITLVRESGGAAKDPVIESVTADKFTVKISSSDQQGEWIWRARGPRRDEKVGPQVGPSHSITPSAGPSMPANVVSNSPLSEPVDEAILSTEAKKKAGEEIAVSNGQPNITEAVLLIHGIRDFAEWQDMVSNVLAEIPNTEIYPLKYGRFDAFRFWFPVWTREAPVRKLLWRIRSARDRFSTAKLSVIAHSFGTYAIGKILKENPDIRLHRLILCGAILPSEFRWDQIRHSVETEIINDCGIRDIWPVLAQSTMFGYGPSGRFGFGTPGVRDRYHDFGHGGVFQEKFVSDFWLPWFRSGNFVKTIAPPPSGARWHLLTIIEIKWLLIFSCLGILFYCFWRSGAWPRHASAHQESASATPASSPAKKDSFVTSLNLEASSYLSDLVSVIEQIKKSNGKDSEANRGIQQLEDLKKRFEQLQPKYVEAVRSADTQVTHELLGEIHVLQQDVLKLVESQVGDISVFWYEHLGRVYAFDPPEGADPVYDKYRRDVDNLWKHTVTVLEKDVYPESTPLGSPSK